MVIMAVEMLHPCSYKVFWGIYFLSFPFFLLMTCKLFDGFAKEYFFRDDLQFSELLESE